MTITFSNTFRSNTWTGGNLTLFDGGKIKVYTASQATLLLEYTLPTPALTQTNGVATFQGTPYTDDSLADGTAADYTIEDSTGTIHYTGANEISTVTDGTGSLQINATTTALTTGQTVEAPNPITLTFPATI